VKPKKNSPKNKLKLEKWKTKLAARLEEIKKNPPKIIPELQIDSKEFIEIRADPYEWHLSVLQPHMRKFPEGKLELEDVMDEVKVGIDWNKTWTRKEREHWINRLPEIFNNVKNGDPCRYHNRINRVLKGDPIKEEEEEDEKEKNTVKETQQKKPKV